MKLKLFCKHTFHNAFAKGHRKFKFSGFLNLIATHICTDKILKMDFKVIKYKSNERIVSF